jgi:serine/threonine-protein kinase PpkA
MSIDIEIPRYSLIQEIGSGSNAVVYLATQEGLDRPVAVRVLRTSSQDDAEIRKVFEKEGRTLAQLEHENIARVYEIGATGDSPYMVMEHLGGGTLAQLMRSREHSHDQVLHIFGQICLAIRVAHCKQQFHRDLNPSSVMMRDSSTPVLTDFGMVRSMTANDTSSSIRFQSPEQMAGQPLDARSDVYTLGLMMYYLLTGHVPYQRANLSSMVDLDADHPLKPLPDELSDLQPMVERMLAANPDDRYQHMLEFYDDLQSISRVEKDYTAGSYMMAASSVAPPGGKGKPGRGKLRNLGLGGSLVIAAGLFALYQWLPHGISEADQQRIEQELRHFGTYMVRMDIYGPVGANATASLEKLLAISTDSQEVREAAASLATIYERDAHDSYMQARLDDANRLVQKGLVLAPEHAGLTRLGVVIRADLDKRERSARVNNLLDAGNLALRRENLLPPRDGNAYSMFQEIQSIDPTNKSAESGLHEIQQQIIEQARDAWTRHSLEKAKILTLEGLELFPDSVLLHDLLADIEHTEQYVQEQNG